MGRDKGKSRGNGEGSIRQRKDGRWEARITIATTIDGKAKQRSFYGATREEAAARLTDALHQHHRGMLVEPDTITVKEWLERWLDGRRHITDRTRANYRHALGHVERHLGRIKLQALRPVQVREAYLTLADEGLAPHTQRYCATLLKSALAEAVDLQLLARNPAQPVKVKRARVEPRAEAWSVDEVTAFLRAARGELALAPIGGAKAKGKHPAVLEVPPEHAEPVQHFACFYLMLTCGLRPGEALGLRWRDVDLDGETVLRVRQSLSVAPDDNMPVIGEVKTPTSRRSLYLSADVVRVLREHRERQRALFGDTELVFVSLAGTAVHPRNLRRRFYATCKLAAVRRIRLHDLRHTYASLALARHVPVELVSRRLGHASPGFTLDRYRHLYQAELREAAVSLDELLTARTSPPN